MGYFDIITSREFAEFLTGYTAALLWSSTDEVDCETVNLDDYELSTAGGDRCRADCLAFFKATAVDLAEAAPLYVSHQASTGYEMAGHDFALTRNGHGAGYWDGDLPEALGDRLTKAAEKLGECWPYLGDDGEVYIQ